MQTIYTVESIEDSKCYTCAHIMTRLIEIANVTDEWVEALDISEEYLGEAIEVENIVCKVINSDIYGKVTQCSSYKACMTSILASNE